MWPTNEFTGTISAEYRFGEEPLDNLNYLRELLALELIQPMLNAQSALEYSSDVARVRRAAEALDKQQSAAMPVLAAIVEKLFNEAGRGFASSAKAFGQVAEEVQAWDERMPPAIQNAVKQFTLQWRDVDQAASKRYFQAERTYSDIMLDLTNAAALQYRLWQLMGALYDAQIHELEAKIAALQKAQGKFRDAADAFVALLEGGVKVAEKALNKLGNTLGLGSFGGALGIGVALLAGVFLLSRGAFSRRK